MDLQRQRTETSDVLDAFDLATRAIAGLQSVDDVLQIVVDQVRPLVGATYAAMSVFDDQGQMEQFLTSGISPEDRARIAHPPQGKGLLGVILREGVSIRVPDISRDPRSAGFPEGHPPMRSFLGVPVTLAGRSIGRLYLTDKQDAPEFTADDQRLVETFALHAAIAIDNARLHEAVGRLAIVDERERISNDLHDGIMQSLYAVGLSLEDVPELAHEDPNEAERRVERAIESIHHTIRDIRNLVLGLRPELLGGTTLLAGMAGIVEEFRHNTMVDIELLAGDIGREPADMVTAHLLGVVNEALSNVARHSGATMASVELDRTDEHGLRLAVVDNGHGFDATGRGAIGHQGLANMRGRAASIGATMELTSGSSGTRVEILVPATDPDIAEGAVT